MTIKDALDTPLLQTMMSRRSIRRYSSKLVPQALLEHLLTAAIWAPSAHNRQPWRFAVIRSPEYKHQLAHAMGKRLKADLQADNVPPEVIERDVTRSYERITSAPVLVLVCLSMADMDTYADEQRNHNEYVMAVQSVAMAAQNLLLAAHDSGLG
ncbi:MAG: nitroreductase family protein, partial [Chloroflexi bacterium]